VGLIVLVALFWMIQSSVQTTAVGAYSISNMPIPETSRADSPHLYHPSVNVTEVLTSFAPAFQAVVWSVDATTSLTSQNTKGASYLPVVYRASAQQTGQTDPPPLCRFGVNATGALAPLPLKDLRVGWYVNYRASSSPERPGGIEYLPIIRLTQTGTDSYSYLPQETELIQAIVANPGTGWLIGNEPDRRIYQDDITPDVYAQAYHKLHELIKSTDPTAQIFAGSIVQPTPVRLKYLDMVLSAYRNRYGTLMPVDGWSIHNFILNEASCEHFPASQCWGADIPPGVDDKEGLRLDVQDNDNFTLFQEQIERFRRWMTDKGYGGLPVYLSEYGVLMPAGYGFQPDFTADRVNAFMDKTFDYMLTTTDPIHGNPNDGHRLIQRFSWYSTTDTTYNGRLFDPGTSGPTDIGNNYADYTKSLSATVDFYPSRIFSYPSGPSSQSEPITLTLKATIANSGNTLSAYQVRIQFYGGDPSTDGRQIGVDQTMTLTGCGDNQTAQVEWANVPPGSHPIYVRVEAVDTMTPEPETAKSNNTRSQIILVGAKGVFMPIISR